MTTEIPGTRPLGLRAALGKKFIAALEADFAKHGSKAIGRLRRTRLQDYLKVVIGLLPDEVLADNNCEDMMDDELEDVLKTVKALIAAKAGKMDRKRTRAPGGGTDAA